MIIALEDARLIYDQIVKISKRKNGKAIIFLGFDLDSLCSLRIILNLFRSDSVRYEIFPVMNYEHMANKLKEFEKDYKGNLIQPYFIFLNCAGSEDFSNHWFLKENLEPNCLLIDTHRPSHHNNIHCNKLIIVDDGYYNYTNCPREEDMEELRNNVEEDEYDSYDDEEEVESLRGDSKFIKDDEQYYGDEEEKKEDKKGKKLRKLGGEIIEEDINEEEYLDELDDIKITKTIKNTDINQKLLKRKIRAKKRQMIQNYYSGSYFGYPSANLLYKLTTLLHKEDNETLWLSIISITDHYLQLRIDSKMYETLYAQTHGEVLRLNRNRDTKIIKSKSSNTEEQIIENKDDYGDVDIKTSNREPKTILLETEYKLYLYRHWSLYDSFIYSNYTLGSLTSWREPGKKEVQKLLAFMGIPLDQANQKYLYMKSQFRDIFIQKVPEISRKFDLTGLLFNSFVYQLDEKTQFSASDFVYSLNATLEYPFGSFNLENDFYFEDTENNINNKLEEHSIKTKDASNCVNNLLLEQKTDKFNNFWYTYDLLSLRGSDKMHKAIDLAIKFQKALVNSGTPVIDKKSITATANFRYATINSDLAEDIKYFQNPLSLERLALFVMDTYHVMNTKKDKVNKPFVLAVFNSINRTYLIAGVLGNAKEDLYDKNQFPIRFRLAASNLGAKLLYTGFDDNIVELNQSDYLAFIERMCEV